MSKLEKKISGSRGPCQKHWCFTLNHPKNPKLPFAWANHLDYCIWQYEVGENDTPHLQGYLVLKKKQRLTRLKSIAPRAHWLASKGSPTQNELYCSKEEGRLSGPWVIGVKPRTAGEASIKRFADARMLAVQRKFDLIDSDIYVRNCSSLHFISRQKQQNLPPLNELVNEWWVGPSGAGKTRKCFNDYPGHYVKSLNKWWDGYIQENEAHQVVCIQDFCPDHFIFATMIKEWGDHYPFKAQIKNGAMNIRPTKVIITSQYEIEDCFKRQVDINAIKRRFKVVHFLMLASIMPSIHNGFSNGVDNTKRQPEDDSDDESTVPLSSED